MGDREKFAVVRECFHCKGSGSGKCRLICHNCKGKGSQVVHLYALDLEGAELVIYVGPAEAGLTAPRIREGVRRGYLTAEEAHREGLRALLAGEILSYVVKGRDDFAGMVESERERALAAYAREVEGRTAARVESEEFPWEDEEQVRHDLERLGQIGRSPLDGQWYLTAKGVARITAALLDGDEMSPWMEQCVKLMSKEIYLTDKAAS